MNKNELLSLLDDADVREKILAIVNHQADAAQEIIPKSSDDDEQQLEETFQADIAAWKEELTAEHQQKDKLQAEVDAWKEKFADEHQRTGILQRELKAEGKRADKLQREVDSWKEKFNDERKRADKLKVDGDAWIKQYEHQQRRANELQGKLETWIKKFNDENDRSEKLQEEFDAAQDKLSRLEDFVHGVEVYQKYQEVSYHTRQLLAGVFTRNGFKSFVCGGAQVNSLETIWDVWRECVMSDNEEDAEILGEVFMYCLELVNASKVQASYSILPVKVGDRFDSDIHVEGPGSRAQGKISAVYLPGYKNNYNRRIIRKSIVQVS